MHSQQTPKRFTKCFKGSTESFLTAEGVSHAGVVLSGVSSCANLVLCHLLTSSLSTHLQIVTPLCHQLLQKLQRIF